MICNNTTKVPHNHILAFYVHQLSVWYRIGAQQLHVNLQKEHHKAGFCHFAIAIAADQYHKYAEKISRSGYKLSCESQQFADGVYRFLLNDPFSNTVEIHQAEKCA